MYIIVETKNGKTHKFPYTVEFLKYRVSNNGGHCFIHSLIENIEHHKMFDHDELKTISIFFEE